MFALILLFGIWRPAGAERVGPDLQINSKQYIVIDADTGEVFASLDPNKRVPIASLTKVFTTIEAIEEAPLDTVIRTKQSDLFGADSTTMGFGPGEDLTLEDLIYGMLLPSGNDAAHAVARGLGHQDGDSDAEAVNRFMARVNQRIQDLGLQDTNLVNPHGLSTRNHYSSAQDLAVFTMYAIQYPAFLDAIETAGYTASDGLTVTNTNKMLNTYPSIVGGKTGYDDEAGWCLIEVARRDGSTMIAVTLNGIAPDDWYDDNRVLLDYAFAQKAERTQSEGGITGQVLSFKDPDAAAIARAAVGGASVGTTFAPANDPPTTELNPAGSGASGEAEGVSVPSIASDDSIDRRVLVVIGVALLIFAAQGLGAFSHPSRRPRSAFLPAANPRRRPAVTRQARSAAATRPTGDVVRGD